MAVLRNRTFFSLGELNAAIAVALKELNERPFQKWPGKCGNHRDSSPAEIPSAAPGMDTEPPDPMGPE
jgi:hypothetical protein